MSAIVKRIGLVLVWVAAGVAPAPAAAQARAAYARPAELAGEGAAHLLEVSTLAQYARVLSGSPGQALTHAGAFVLRTRLALGRAASFGVGFDGELGASDAGVVYGLTAYPLGLAARFGDGDVLALRGGVGVDGVGGSVPVAARFPAELALGLSTGPLRTTVWARPAWVAGAPERARGTTWLPVVDEFEAGILVRVGRQRRYWSRLRAGGGPAFGVTYREVMGARMLGVVFGLDFTGAQ